METILIGYAIIAVFCAGRFTGKDYEDYYMVMRFIAGWLWPVLLVVFGYKFLEQWVQLAWKGNFCASIKVLVFGRNLWKDWKPWTVKEKIEHPPKFKKMKVWGWLYQRAFDRLVVMNKDKAT